MQLMTIDLLWLIAWWRIFTAFFYWTKCTKDFNREMLLQKCQVFELKLKLIEIQYSPTQSDSCFFLSYRIKLNSERITLCNKKLNDIKQTCRICNKNNKNTTNLFAFIIKEQILIIIDKWKPYIYFIFQRKKVDCTVALFVAVQPDKLTVHKVIYHWNLIS